MDRQGIKIAFTVTTDLNYDQRMIRICGTLARNGYKVILIGREKNNSIPLTSTEFEQHRIRCWFNKSFLFYLEYNIRLYLFLVKQKIGAICSVDLDTVLAGYFVKKKLVIPHIFDAHEYFVELPELEGRPFVRSVWNRIGKLAVPGTDLCYTVGESLGSILSKRYGKSFYVISNYPFKSKENSPVHNNSRIILYQGALNHGRGLEVAIAAMEKLDDVILHLAGEGDLSQELRRLSKDLKLEDKVFFHGYVEPDKLKEITSTAWLGLNLLEGRSQNYYYSLANKYFDYIQSGVPSLNMAFPEYKRLNDRYETGVLLEELDVDKYVQAVNEIMANPALYEKLRNNCQLASEEFIWEKEEKKLLNYYDNLFIIP